MHQRCPLQLHAELLSTAANALYVKENKFTIRDIVRKLRSSSAAQAADLMAIQNHEHKPAAQTH
jgi:hypothetical protein